MKQYRINKILVPIDFSPISLNALRHAERIARLTQARITAVHIVKPYIDVIGEPGVVV